MMRSFLCTSWNSTLAALVLFCIHSVSSGLCRHSALASCSLLLCTMVQHAWASLAPAMYQLVCASSLLAVASELTWLPKLKCRCSCACQLLPDCSKLP